MIWHLSQYNLTKLFQIKLKKTKHYKSYLMGAERMNLLANKIQEAKTHSGKKNRQIDSDSLRVQVSW